MVRLEIIPPEEFTDPQPEIYILHSSMVRLEIDTTSSINSLFISYLHSSMVRLEIILLYTLLLVFLLFTFQYG